MVAKHLLEMGLNHPVFVYITTYNQSKSSLQSRNHEMETIFVIIRFYGPITDSDDYLSFVEGPISWPNWLTIQIDHVERGRNERILSLGNILPTQLLSCTLIHVNGPFAGAD